ncbi:TetR/AcrR family transcriptional regulator C-terminal domain-containing protein [Candidatus Marimicrobium litorale]|nr:TetR/AcrR family transcriptional regulator C-terminal domain-containing protein [Candidatus Marimicrobium litorale]
MAKPLLATENIYDTALHLLEVDGVGGLSARNLAAALKCSTRTLYQQVGKRETLISALVAHYFASVKLSFREEANWQDSARSWASNLRSALLAHPNLSQLMSGEHRAPVADYVNQLLKVLVAEGFDETMALRSCRVLANIAISLSLSEIIAPIETDRHAERHQQGTHCKDPMVTSKGKNHRRGNPPEVFENAINWVIAGIEAERLRPLPNS